MDNRYPKSDSTHHNPTPQLYRTKPTEFVVNCRPKEALTWIPESNEYFFLAQCCLKMIATMRSTVILVLGSLSVTLGLRSGHMRHPLSNIAPKPYTLLQAHDTEYKGTSGIKRNFITNIIDDDLSVGRNEGRILTRFPPEPNGYLHLGHAKSICFNFGVATDYNGATNMRFDDTNPEKEDQEYVDSILDDVRWLIAGDTKAIPAPWNQQVRHASDYFDILYQGAVYLIEQGKAYVEDLNPEEMREYRGTLTTPGKNSPSRNRSVKENLQIFEKMKHGDYEDGSYVLRAKIDMSSSNMNLRDPTLYRIKTATHPMTGDKWKIYPMYDYTHAVSDALEQITHSLCTLEFEDHRPLYNWVIDALLPSGLLPCSPDNRPVQTEFSRLNLEYTVLSKRKLIKLVKDGHVEGWDDPRMPTICGVRRRGFPSEAIRTFCNRVGMSRADSTIDMAILEDCVREFHDSSADRLMAVLDPLPVTITNWPGNGEEIEIFEAPNHPKLTEHGTRPVIFSKRIIIDREDFFDTGPDGSLRPPTGFKRLVPGSDVRLRLAYVISCDEVIRDPSSGSVLELRCSYKPDTRAGSLPEGMKRPKGIIQWVSEAHAVDAEIRLYDRLFRDPSPGKSHEDGDFLKDINPDSLKVVKGAKVEKAIALSSPGHVYQFERMGYFCVDVEDNSEASISQGRELKLNRVVGLANTWASDAKGVDNKTGGRRGKEDNTKGDDGAAKAAAKAAQKARENLPDACRIELRAGRVVSASAHPDADSLYVLQVDLGEADGSRTIVSGLANFILLERLVDSEVVVVANLKPSKMRGVESCGMILCPSSGENSNEVCMFCFYMNIA
jgi:glutaminyl-tRNA synthetase